MSSSRIARLSRGLVCVSSRSHVASVSRSQLCQLRNQVPARLQHNTPQKRLSARLQEYSTFRNSEAVAGNRSSTEEALAPSNAGRYAPRVDPELPDFDDFPKVKVRYLRPAIWALAVSGGIFVGLSYLEARRDFNAQKANGWMQAPQLKWNTSTRSPPTPIEVATGWWADVNPIMKVSYGLIGANATVHASSFLVPRFWDTLWHLPARNVNYTQFTSMFVHSGALHFFVNMYFLNNFLTPVGYSRLFEGSPYHTLSFLLSAGVLSGFAQHWSTLIPIQKRAIPEIFIRCGGASGALFGVLGAFCMQYPTAGLGILFVPVHFDAQYVLPAIMLFDFVGMIRGYSFVNFGHAAHFSGAVIGVAYSYFDGKKHLWKPLVRYWKLQMAKQ